MASVQKLFLTFARAHIMPLSWACHDVHNHSLLSAVPTSFCFKNSFKTSPYTDRITKRSIPTFPVLQSADTHNVANGFLTPPIHFH